MEQIVVVPAWQRLDDTVHAARIIAKERTQQRTAEDNVDVPFPRTQREIDEMVEASPPERVS